MQNVPVSCLEIQVQQVARLLEVAMELAKEAYNPRLTLEQWIEQGAFASSTATTGLKSIDDIKREENNFE